MSLPLGKDVRDNADPGAIKAGPGGTLATGVTPGATVRGNWGPKKLKPFRTKESRKLPAPPALTNCLEKPDSAARLKAARNGVATVFSIAFSAISNCAWGFASIVS